MTEQGAAPQILWDHGTAYDLFASMYAIHTPEDFGIRASWAAGVRSRLSAGTREFLANVMLHMEIPTPWLYSLSQPKNAESVLELLEGLKPEEVLPTVSVNPRRRDTWQEVELAVLRRGRCDETDVEKYRACCTDPDCRMHDALQPRSVKRWLEYWAEPERFGPTFLAALTEFYEVFFRAEEKRITGDLDRALERAYNLSTRLSPAELFEELSQGIRVKSYIARRSLVLVPCYWCSPRIIPSELADDAQIVLFGARPPEASLIPGDTVPARLMLCLEALSNPTRLAIMRCLAEKPMTQAEIARALRLRPPTISHHLKSLRLAGLIAYIDSEKDEMRYGARVAQIDQVSSELKSFFRIDGA
jgi:DNA-binding transcriptional ArsR family regulator